MKREPEINNRYNSKDWQTQYKVIMYNKDKWIVTYQTMTGQQYTKDIKSFSSKIAKYEKQ